MGLSLSFVVCFEGVRSSSRPKIRAKGRFFPPRLWPEKLGLIQSSSLFLQPHLIFMISDLWCMTFNITRSCRYYYHLSNMRFNFTINVRRKRYQFYWTYVLNRLVNGLGPFTRQNTKYKKDSYTTSACRPSELRSQIPDGNTRTYRRLSIDMLLL